MVDRYLKEERDRIWSAAVKAYRNGEQWWLTDSEEKLSQQNNQQFQIIDEWQSAIAKYLEGREQVSIMEILTKIFEIEAGKVDRRSQMRVANILTNLEWKKVGQKQHQGKRQVVWRRATPLLNEESIAKVLRCEASPLGQPKSQTGQSLSTPATPTMPKDKTTKEDGQQQGQETKNKNVLKQKLEGVAQVSKADSVRDAACYTQQKNSATNSSEVTVTEKSIDWKTYPYNSSDRTTLENRANKVKERVLGCTTSNELNQLLFSSKATEVELNWLSFNYMSKSEIEQLQQIQSSTQGNLFSSSSGVVEYEYREVIAEIDREMKRLGWSTEDGRNYISDRYNKKSRLHLSDEQLLEFWNYLKSLK